MRGWTFWNLRGRWWVQHNPNFFIVWQSNQFPLNQAARIPGRTPGIEELRAHKRHKTNRVRRSVVLPFLKIH